MKINLSKEVSLVKTVLAIATTIGSVTIVGALFSSQYKSDCTINLKTHTKTCTDHFEFNGFSGLPLQPIASAFGVGMGAFVLVSKAKNVNEILHFFVPTNNTDNTPPSG